MPAITLTWERWLSRWFPDRLVVGPLLIQRNSVARREATINAALTAAADQRNSAPTQAEAP